MQKDTVQQRFEAAASAVVDLAQRHLEPIFGVGPAGQPDFEGSGLLLRIGDRHFLVSAAHVFSARSADIILLPDDNSGPLTPRNKPETTRGEKYKEEHVNRWCEMRTLVRGAVISLEQCWQLARRWYPGRLNLNWTCPSVDGMEETFVAVGLKSQFGSLR